MTPAELGAKLVAERDAAWLRAHAGGAEVKELMAPHDEIHAMRPMHRVKKGGITDGNPAMPQK